MTDPVATLWECDADNLVKIESSDSFDLSRTNSLFLYRHGGQGTSHFRLQTYLYELQESLCGIVVGVLDGMGRSNV